MHIVPVSGLAISIVCRLENEHKTGLFLLLSINHSSFNQSMTNSRLSDGDVGTFGLSSQTIGRYITIHSDSSVCLFVCLFVVNGD